MKQEAFEKLHSSTWDRFETWVRALSGDRSVKLDWETQRLVGREFPGMYRQICHHLAISRSRRYSIGLQQRLNQLALDGHQHLYRSRTPLHLALARFVVFDFPATVRRFRGFVLASAMLFSVPALAIAIAMQFHPELVFSLLDPSDVSQIEQMYDPSNSVLGRERQSDTDILMFGYYIYNNISIGFQTFAGGLLFGLGSVFYLLHNGLLFGAIATHLTTIGFTSTFWTFVAAHSAFELTAIVIFGGVGLMLGYGAIAPGRKTRWGAIRDRAISGMPLVYGASLMLVAAAFLEAFWSSTTWPPDYAKYAVGATLWVLLALYFSLAGRNES